MNRIGEASRKGDGTGRAPSSPEGSGVATFTGGLLDVAGALRFDALPDEAIAQAKACVLDTLGVALAGWSEDESSIVFEHVRSSYGEGPSSILGTTSSVAPEGAALANGTLAHALDYDDTSWTYIGHASAVILPAALAIGESRASSGRDLITAYVAGLEVAARIGESLTDEFARRGWHLTSAIGVFGAAIAAGSLLGLSREQLSCALGIAASRASGLKANFGYTVKPFHAGMAAADGVQSALLAQAGLTACPTALEDRLGFFAAFADRRPPEAVAGVDELAIVADGVAFKRYPSCTGSHPAVDAVLAIVADEGIAPADVESVRIGTTPEVPGELLHPWPTSGSQAKFSMGFAVAVALSNGRLGLEHFTDEIVGDEAIRDLMRRCEVFVDTDLERPTSRRWPAASVEITTAGGQVHRRRVDAARGNPGNQLTSAELDEKFFDCAGRTLPAAQVTALRDLAWSLEQVDDIGELLAQARGTE